MKMVPIPGFEYYLASDDGRIYSIRKKKFLKQRVRNDGYNQVTLAENGKRAQCYVHRIIAISFLGKKDDLQVNHIDENKSNNAISNLEWVTPKENILHGTGIKRRIATHTIEKLRQSQLNAVEYRKRPVKCVETHKTFDSTADASRKMNINRSSISSALSGKYKTAGGYHWDYV